MVRNLKFWSIRRLRLDLCAAITVVGLSASSAPALSQIQKSAATQIDFEWKQTALLEHEDRKNRFRRLAAQGALASPQFFETVIDRQYLTAFKINLPVLRLVFSQQVFFDTDKSDLRPESLPVLEAVAKSLQKDVPDVAVFVAGHADARGSEDYNHQLSVARANTVSRHLYSLGIGMSRLWSVGFGKSVPIKPNTTAENMSENRRVEFLFSARPEAIAIWMSQQLKLVCAKSPGLSLADCTSRLAARPTVLATPVLSEKTTGTISEKPTDVKAGTEIATVPAGADATRITMKNARQVATAEVTNTQIVQIEKNSPIVIDLKEQRVSVGAPIL